MQRIALRENVAQGDFVLKTPHVHEGEVGLGTKKAIMAEVKRAALANPRRPAGKIVNEVYRDALINRKIPARMMPKKDYARG